VPTFSVDDCDTDVVFDGVSYGKAPVVVFDPLNNGTEPVGYFEIPELQEGNRPRFWFGEGSFEDIAIVTLGGGQWAQGSPGGAVLYDFSDPLRPVAVSDLRDDVDLDSAIFGVDDGDRALFYSINFEPGADFAEVKEVAVKRAD